MKNVDLVAMAGGNLVRHKLRTGLTVLGIIIGGVSILLMISLGLALQDSITKSFTQEGGLNNIRVLAKNTQGFKSRLSETPDNRMNDSDVYFLKGIEGVKTVVPQINLYDAAVLRSGKYVNSTMVVGVDPNQIQELGLRLDQGRLLEPGKMAEAVMSEKALDQFKSDTGESQVNEITVEFGGPMLPVKKDYKVDPFKDRIGLEVSTSYREKGNEKEKVVVNKYPFYTVGLLKSEDFGGDNVVYMPIETVKKMKQESYAVTGRRYREEYDTLYVVVDDLKQISQITNQIKNAGYTAFSTQSLLDSIIQSLAVVQIVLGAIGGVSLMVAAIGITNTMIMAVTERKKEIGIMKVIGATIKDIKKLFLIESAMIGTLGGILGILISLGFAGIINSSGFSQFMSGGGSAEFKMTIPLWLVAAGVSFTTIIGILSGYLPARKAMRSSALDALRNE